MEEVEEGYQDARDEEFNEQLIHFMDGTPATEEDIQGFMDSFTFPDPSSWCYDKVMADLDEIGDQQYEQMRDERCGL